MKPQCKRWGFSFRELKVIRRYTKYEFMKKQMIDIKTRDGLCDTYISYPENRKNLPIVLLFMDAVGLRPRIYEMTDKIAESGYFALAPNLFYRSKRAPAADYATLLKPDRLPELWQIIMPMAKALSTEMNQSDVDSFLSYAKEQPQVNPKKIGSVGYCMGGGQALRNAGNFPNEFSVAASYHAAGLCTDLENSPHLWFKKIKCEVYIGHADNDQHMPPEQQRKVKAALDEAHLKYTAELYPHCLHGWTMKDLPAYNKEGEEKHWQTLLSLFARTLQT